MLEVELGPLPSAGYPLQNRLQFRDSTGDSDEPARNHPVPPNANDATCLPVRGILPLETRGEDARNCLVLGHAAAMPICSPEPAQRGLCQVHARADIASLVVARIRTSRQRCPTMLST